MIEAAKSRHVDVLDHGYVRVVESWGSDASVIESARMSTDKGFLGWGPKHVKDCPNESNVYDCKCNEPGDEKLLAYLYKNHHMTPFEMAGLIIEVQAPIFVFREWHRHRTQSYNELSARYTPMPNINYVPTVERLMMGGGHLTKQAGSIKDADVLDAIGAEKFRQCLIASYYDAEHTYQDALKSGVSKELARLIIPVGRYSRMRASANLRSWLMFLTLRMDPAAQWEIRQFANAVGEHLKFYFPRTWDLFVGGSK